MAEQDIIQNLISRLGQSQADRLPPELESHFVDVDERKPDTLLSQAAALAKLVRFYSNDDIEAAGDWSSFFPATDEERRALLDRDDGGVTPHLGLFAAFLRLYRYPQKALNELTGRHLDFQFQRVLRFVPRPARGDHAHLLLELKKGADPIVITPEQAFSAGKDGKGVELIYRPVRDVVINHGQVEQLKSVFRDPNRLRFAPIANSADGLGSPLDKERPKWHAFGNAGLPDAQIGFAVASPVLRMAEGNRTIHIELQLIALNPQRHTARALTEAFAAHLTGPKGWIEAQSLSAQLAGSQLTLTATIPTEQPAIIDYDAKIHGHVLAAQSPVLQLLLRQDGGLRYQDFTGLAVGQIRIWVVVESLTALVLENDFGKINAKKPFQPFGPQPVVGSRFMVGCDEALSKRLRQLSVKLTWLGAPPKLWDWYANYDHQKQMEDGIGAQIAFVDRSGQSKQVPRTLIENASTAESTLKIEGQTPIAPPQDNKTDSRLFALSVADTSKMRGIGLRLAKRLPLYQRALVPSPTVRSGYITIALDEDFLHGDYRRLLIANALKPVKEQKTLNEPYTPTVQAISLTYTAESDKVDLNENSLDSFTNPDLQFFHVGCFGQMREHAYARHQFAFLPDKRVSLLPAYPSEGEFLIGVSGVTAGDSLSLLLQAAEGSADPDLPAEQLSWAVLCDNYWRPLTNSELVLDTTRGLRTSGIVALALPAEVTTQHSIMPTGQVWLRASIQVHSASVCQLIQVANNAVEVGFADQGNDPAHLENALPAKSITKLKSPQVNIKSAAQPFATFDARPLESGKMLTRRAAERVRHRNRCITAWDYERMLLEAFPAVHQVKCIPHASESSWLAPGNVLLVVVPDLRNQNAVDPLRPRVDTGTLSQMTEFALQHRGMQVRIRVKNPRYQRVKLAFQVKFMPGLPFHFYRGQLHEALVRVLSPWAFEAEKSIQFGGRVYRSVLLDFVEKLSYVDFVTDFKLLSPDGDFPHQDLPSIQAAAPDAILVSDTLHTIDEFTDT